MLVCVYFSFQSCGQFPWLEFVTIFQNDNQRRLQANIKKNRPYASFLLLLQPPLYDWSRHRISLMGCNVIHIVLAISFVNQGLRYLNNCQTEKQPSKQIEQTVEY